MDLIHELQSLVKRYLADKYLYSDYPVEEHFKSRFVLDFDYFVNHTVFEILYEQYIRNNPTASVMNFYREDILKRPTLMGTYIENTYPEYKNYLRKYEGVRRHNDDIARELGAEELDEMNVQFKLLDTPQSKQDGHRVREFQRRQLVHIKEHKIFDYIRKGMLADIKKVSRHDFEEAVSVLEDLYAEIQEADQSSFWKSLQYYQLELMCNFEYFYSIAKAMKESKLKRVERDIEKRILAFPLVHTVHGWMQNKFILGKIQYIDHYREGRVLWHKIIEDFEALSVIKWLIKRDILYFHYKDNTQFLSVFDEEAEFFTQLYGSGQHIQVKDWYAIRHKDFRDLYAF